MLGDPVKKYSLEENMNINPSTIFLLRRNTKFGRAKNGKITPAHISLAHC